MTDANAEELKEYMKETKLKFEEIEIESNNIGIILSNNV